VGDPVDQAMLLNRWRRGAFIFSEGLSETRRAAGAIRQRLSPKALRITLISRILGECVIHSAEALWPCAKGMAIAKTSHRGRYDYKSAIDGRLPHGMGVARLTDLPAEWSRQRQMLGFPSH
jgi:hypothetical protein